MSKWHCVDTDPPKRAGTYLVVMECIGDPHNSHMDVQIYWPKRKEWDCDWSDDMRRAMWTTCPKPKGFIGQKWREKDEPNAFVPNALNSGAPKASALNELLGTGP